MNITCGLWLWYWSFESARCGDGGALDEQRTRWWDFSQRPQLRDHICLPPKLHKRAEVGDPLARKMFCAKLKELKISGECPFSSSAKTMSPETLRSAQMTLRIYCPFLRTCTENWARMCLDRRQAEPKLICILLERASVNWHVQRWVKRAFFCTLCYYTAACFVL